MLNFRDHGKIIGRHEFTDSILYWIGNCYFGETNFTIDNKDYVFQHGTPITYLPKYSWGGAYNVRRDLLIYKVIDFCEENYKNTACLSDWQPKCEQHINDPNIEIKGTVLNECAWRLKNVQQNPNEDYNCLRFLYYYNCKYLLAYCSEIISALALAKGLKEFPYYNILSLGCGNAVDLLAFDYLMNYDSSLLNFGKINMNQYSLPKDTPLTYLGLDLSPSWNTIQEMIKKNTPWKQEIDFRLDKDGDVLTYFDKVKSGSTNSLEKNRNVYIISYLLSKIGRGSDYSLDNWYDKLANYIKETKPKDSPVLIIYNDTVKYPDHYLITAINQVGLHIISTQKYYFDNNKNWDHTGYELNPLQQSIQNPENDGTKRDPFWGFFPEIYTEKRNDFTEEKITFQRTYQAMHACQSFQLILEVE